MLNSADGRYFQCGEAVADCGAGRYDVNFKIYARVIGDLWNG